VSKHQDISQRIRKYLNGDLDARAMHQLEKEAQNDPFLMEALEGYEKTSADQQSNLDDLYEKLEQRTAKKQAKVVPFRAIAIAASVLLFLGLGILWLANRHPYISQTDKIVLAASPKEKQPADTLRQTEDKQKLTATLIPQNKAKRYVPSVTADRFIAKDKTTSSLQAPQPPASADMVVSEPVGNADSRVAEVNKPADILKNDSTVIAYKNAKSEYVNALPGKAEGVQTNPAPFSHQLNNEIVSSNLSLNKAAKPLTYNSAGIKPDDFKSNQLTGVVKDETGAPLPGASVKVKGTSIITQTDANGKFTINSLPDNTVLNVGFLGYTTKEIAANKRDSLVIAMQPNQNELAEVVTTAYGISKSRKYQPAHPKNGWDEFEKYLTDNAISPDGRTGTVKLSFTVNPDNSLSDFKIIKSISAKTDSAAIDLVTDGPNWQRATSGKAEKVKLSIKFNGK
jgi:hypothetical protein